MGRITQTAAITTLVLATGVAAPTLADRGKYKDHGKALNLDFSAVDINSDGKLDQNELTVHTTEWLTTADSDSDGSLDRVELVAIEPPQGGKKSGQVRAENRADWILKRHGGAGAGQIRIVEMVVYHVQKMLVRADLNNDSVISEEEAKNTYSHFRGGGKNLHASRHHDGTGSSPVNQ